MNFSNVCRNTITTYQLLLTIFLLTTLISLAHAEVPVVFWHSQPVKPNETVMVQGHAISTSTLVDVQRLDDSASGSPIPVTSAVLTNPVRITPLSYGESILNFVVPANWQNGVFAYRPVNELAGSVHLVNAPEPWFFQADQGNRATPGGWVAVYGNMLAMVGGTAKLSLVNNGVEVSQLVARSGGNSYAQYFDLPVSLPLGSYYIYVHNGFGGAATWTRLTANETVGSDQLKIVSRDMLWETIARAQPEVVIDAANGNGGAGNWDAVFATAIATVKSHKDATGKALGGVIRIKPGIYTLDKYLVLPDKAILAGDFGNRDTTTLQWGDSPVPDPAGKHSLIMGETIVNYPYVRGTFSIEDLTLSRSSTNRVGVCIERAYTNTEEQSAWFRRMNCSEVNTAEAAKNAITAGNVENTRPAFWMRATKNTEISDSTIDMIAGVTLYGNNATNEHLRIENNTFRWRFAPLNVLYELKNLVYSGNIELMLGTENANGTGTLADVGDFIGSFGNNDRDIYFAKNQMLREGSDVPYAQLGLTLDGNAGVYLGKITSVSGTTINLAGVTSIPQPNTSIPANQQLPRARLGAMVQILSGKGAGQWRHLTSPVLDSTTNLPVNIIQIDRPWDVDPDTTSWLSINDFQGRMIFYGNNLENAPKLQPYYASHDVIVAENLLTTKQNAVIPVWVGYRGGGYGSMTHGWHYQVLDNIASGNVSVNMPTIITSLDKSETIVPQWGSYPGYDGSYVSTHIYRGNHNNNSPIFEISPNGQNSGFLIENNTGLSSLLFQEPPFKQEMGLIRNNTSPEGNRPQLYESSSGKRFTTDPGTNVTFSYTDGSIINLARSALATAVNDFGGYGRSFPVDGRINPLWTSNQVASSGTAAQPWFQVDLRSSNIIQSVKIWPMLDPGLETSDVWVLVSPTPFTSNDLDTERARPEVFSQFLAGKFFAARSADLTTVQGGKYTGRYVRAWKTYLPGSGNLQLSEIEVLGYNTNVQGILAVGKNGAGAVTSSPAGINCGAGCSAVYDANSIITLSATADAGAVFVGWSGACTGGTTCSVTMDTSKNVTATFNIPPVANPGIAQTVSEVSAVTLVGSGSDADGTIAGYLWLQTAGPAVTLTGANTAMASFIAPAVATDTVLAFQLTVTDNLGTTSIASTYVVASAPVTIPPTASNENDVPTLPEWASILLGLTLLGAAVRSREKQRLG